MTNSKPTFNDELHNVPVVEVPVTSTLNAPNSTILKLIEQGGMIGALVLVCVFVWLLTKLIKVAKDD